MVLRETDRPSGGRTCTGYSLLGHNRAWGTTVPQGTTVREVVHRNVNLTCTAMPIYRKVPEENRATRSQCLTT